MRTLTVIVFCLAAASAASAASPQTQPSAVDALRQAVGLLDEGRFQEAVKGFQRADELAGGSCGPCQLGLSRSWLGLQQPEKAVVAARKAVELLRAPDLAGQGWNQLGMALASGPRPDLDGAEQAFRKAVETGASSRLVNISRYNLADVLWRQKKYGESEQFARAALVSDPAGPAAGNARITLCQARTDGAPIAPPETLYAETACPKDPLRAFEEKVDASAEGKEVSPPRKIFGNGPQYDDKARQDGAEGTVILESIIDDNGCIQKLRVCKSLHPSLDLAALDTVRRWVFEPATLGGQPVKVYYTLTVNFQIGNRPGPG